MKDIKIKRDIHKEICLYRPILVIEIDGHFQGKPMLGLIDKAVQDKVYETYYDSLKRSLKEKY